MKYNVNSVNTDQKAFGDFRKLAELQKFDSQHSIPKSMLLIFRLSVPSVKQTIKKLVFFVLKA